MNLIKLVGLNKIRVSKYFLNLRWEFGIFFILSFIGLLWFKPGFSYELVGRGDFLSPYNVFSYLLHRTNAYDINRFFGIDVSSHLSHVFTYLGYFYLFEVLGFQATLATGVFYLIILFFSMFSFYSYVSKFISYRFKIEENISLRIIKTACSVIFAYSPVLVSLLIPGHSVLLLAYAFFPYLLGVIEDINFNKDTFSTYFFVFLVFFIIAPSFSNVGVFFVHNLGLLLYALATLTLLRSGKNVFAVVKKYFYIFLVILLSNLWWLLPSIITLSGKVSRAISFSVINKLAPVSPYYSIANILMLRPYGIMHVDASLVHIYDSIVYKLISMLILITPICVFLFAKKWNYRKVITAVLVLVLVGIYISKGYNPPFEFVFSWLYEHIVVFKVFRRSVSKFYWFVYIFQMLLFSLAVIILWMEKKKFQRLIVYFMILVTLFHLVNYKKFNPAIYFFDTPDYLKDGTTYLMESTYTFVYIPHSYKTQPSFNEALNYYSGRDIVDYIWDFRYTRPDLSREELPNFSQKNLNNQLYLLIHDKKTKDNEVCNLTRKVGLTHIVVRKNIINTLVDPEITALMLKRLDIYDDIKTFGNNEDLIVFDLKDSCSSDFIFSNKSSIDSVQAFSESFYLINSNDPNYLDINFMVNYSKNWRLLPVDEKMGKTPSLSLFINILKDDLSGKSMPGNDRGQIYWEIFNTGQNNYVIYYRPQIYFYLGGVLTATAFISLFSTLLIKWLRYR